MLRYIIRRVLLIFVIVFASAIVIFSITYLVPGDPAANLLGNEATPEELANMRAVLGVDKPFIVQLGTFLYNVFLKFDFGDSWVFKQPVFAEMVVRMPRTATIGAISMGTATIFGILLGVMAGTHEGKWQDSLMMTIAIIFASAPGFWVAMMMIVLFTVKLGWLPSYGIGSWKNYVMPCLSGAMHGIAMTARQQRNSILEVFRADYITTARAKGVAERDVVYKHMLPNSMLPIITQLGGTLTGIFVGGVITENVFSIPGVGLYMLSGINNRDYPVIRGTTLFFAAFNAVVMLLVDIVYAYVDPRIKQRYTTGKKA